VESKLHMKLLKMIIIIRVSIAVSFIVALAMLAVAHAGSFAIFQINGGGAIPAVNSVLPSNGGLYGGTRVTIVGTNLGSPIGVTFGGVAATSFVGVSATKVTAVAPAGSSKVNVQVQTASGLSPTGAANQFQYQGITESFAAGVTDGNGVIIGGTEYRQGAAHVVPLGGFLQKTGAASWAICATNSAEYDASVGGCHVFFGGMGFWKDSNCSTNNSGANQGPQIDILTTSLGSWTNDINISGSGYCTGLDVINSLVDVDLSYNGSGASINADIVVAGNQGAIAGAISLLYARNDATGLWPTLVPSGTGTIRSAGHHIDSSQTTNACADGNCRDYLLIGRNTSGVTSATFLASPWGFTSVATEPFSVDGTSSNLCSSQTLVACTNLNSQWTGLSFTSCGAGNPLTVRGCLASLRVMSVVECPVTSGGNIQGKAVFQSDGWQIWRRMDAGSSSYWVLWNQAPNSIVVENTRQNGFRGLACIPTTTAGVYKLLAFAQIDGSMISFDPNTQMTLSPPGNYGGTTEVNVGSCVSGLWTGSGSQGSNISGYNGADMIAYNNSILISGFNARPTPSTRPSYATEDAVGGFWMRPVAGPGSGACNGYALYPSSPGTTDIAPTVLAAIQTNTCGQAGGCANTYNGNLNPTPQRAINCTTDVNGYCSIMGSDRDIRCSPFLEDGANAANGYCGQVLFYGGRDMDAATGHNTAWAVRVPIDASVAIP
jgi:hypothetical protein